VRPEETPALLLGRVRRALVVNQHERPGGDSAARH
jgi:hypothetical protein